LILFEHDFGNGRQYWIMPSPTSIHEII